MFALLSEIMLVVVPFMMRMENEKFIQVLNFKRMLFIEKHVLLLLLQPLLIIETYLLLLQHIIMFNFLLPVYVILAEQVRLILDLLILMKKVIV